MSLPVKTRNLPDEYDPREIEWAIQDVLTALNAGFRYVRLQQRNAEPEKTTGGELYLADGTDWAPFGTGAQELVFRGSTNAAWRYVVHLASAPSSSMRSFLQNGTSSSLANAVTDDTGSGSLVFSNSPVLSNATITGTRFFQQNGAATYAAAATLAESDLLGGLIQFTGAGASALTTPTGAQIDAAITTALGSALGASRAFDFSVVNTGSATATLTAAASGVTRTGAGGVTAGTSGIFRCRKTAADTFTIFRIA